MRVEVYPGYDGRFIDLILEDREKCYFLISRVEAEHLIEEIQKALDNKNYKNER